MAGAQDYLTVKGPEGASYQMGNYAQMLQQAISNLPEDYFKGTQMARTLRQQNMFKDGLPTGQDGKPDYSAILQQLVKGGGADTAKELLPAIQKQPFFDRLLKEDGEGPQQPTAPNLAPRAGQAPAMLDRANAGGQGGQPAVSSAGMDSKGGETVQSLFAGIGGANRDAPPAAIANVARSLGIAPDAPIPPEKIDAATARIGNYFRRTAQAPVSPEENASAGIGSRGAPTTPASGGPISPAPSPAAGGAPAAAGGAPNMVPPGVDPLAYAQRLKQRAEAMRRQGDIRGVVGIPSKAREDQAAALDKQADAILEQLGKAGEEANKGRIAADTKIKETTDPRVIAAKRQAETDKNDIERFGKQYESIQHQADETNKLVDTLKLTKSLMDDPNFYSGAGADHVLAAKRIGVALGLVNPDAAQAMEVFGKTVSAAILDQIRSLGGQGLGQVRVAEINVMKQAAQNHDNTPGSNRTLTELQMRMAEKWTLPIAELARNYNNGHLDAGFDKVKQGWVNKHPLLSQEELADPRRIAPPLVRTPGDLKKIGWKDGDPFRTPDGRILTHIAKQ